MRRSSGGNSSSRGAVAARRRHGGCLPPGDRAREKEEEEKEQEVKSRREQSTQDEARLELRSPAGGCTRRAALPSSSAGSPSSPGWLVRCPLRQGGKGRSGRKKNCPSFVLPLHAALGWSSSTTGTLLGGLFTQASLCLCVSNRSTCSSSCCTVSPSCGYWFQGWCHRQRADSPSGASTVLCGTKIDNGVLAVGHGTGVPSSTCGAGQWRPCRWSRVTIAQPLAFSFSFCFY